MISLGFLTQILLVFVPFGGAEPIQVLGYRPGYLLEVEHQRHTIESEIVFVSPPEIPNTFIMGRPLVNSKIEKEFQSQYELKFGRTDAERNMAGPGRYTFFEYPDGKPETFQNHRSRERRFGEYMFRRLTEYHVDQYFKSNRDMRPIYELKDKIANVNIEVRKSYKLKLNYSYSGNYLDMKFENPTELATKVTLQFGGLASINRSIYSLGYPVSKISNISLYHEYDTDASFGLVGSRQLTRTLSTTLTFTRNTLVDHDQPKTSERQDLALIGFVWTE